MSINGKEIKTVEELARIIFTKKQADQLIKYIQEEKQKKTEGK